MTRVTTETIRQIRALRSKGWHVLAIALQLGFNESTVRKYQSAASYAATRDREKRKYAAQVAAKKTRRKS